MTIEAQNVENEMRKQIEKTIKREPPKLNGGAVQFERDGEKLADALVEAAKEAVRIAEENLKKAEQFAKELRDELHQRAEAHNDLVHRLTEFGNATLDAHQRFHNNEIK